MANYYDILGVKKDATQDEIKSAYRKLVKQYHPDLHPGDANCAAKFKEVNEANEVLSDPQKRRQYDFEQEHPNMGGFNFGGDGGFGGFGDIFGDIFSQFTGGSSGYTERNTKGQDVTLELELSFLDAAKGCKRDVTYVRKEPCSACKSTGAKNGTQYSTCKNCGGSGQVQYMSGGGIFRSISVKACPECSGTGKKITEKCDACSGRGYNKKNTTVTLDIPAGADTNSYMKKRGYGDASTKGGDAGDLIVVFKVLSHKMFVRKGYDIFIELPISYKTAVLGGKVMIPTLEDAIEFSIPEGTQSGKKFIVRGKGIKSRQGTGDMYVTVTIEVPTRISRSQKASLEKFDADVDFKQYDKIKRYDADMKSLFGVDSYKKK